MRMARPGRRGQELRGQGGAARSGHCRAAPGAALGCGCCLWRVQAVPHRRCMEWRGSSVWVRDGWARLRLRLPHRAIASVSGRAFWHRGATAVRHTCRGTAMNHFRYVCIVCVV